MLERRRAVVRPRVVSPHSGETLLLEDEILSLLERGRAGIVWLTGGPGSGKTTALAHLAAVLPASAAVSLVEENDQFLERPGKLIVGCGNFGTAPKNTGVVYQLAPWTEDEILEYLCAAHCARCESVVRRCRLSPDRQLLRGNPELWRLVLDVLADDEAIPTIKDALRRVVESRLPDRTAREFASAWCLAILLGKADVGGKYRRHLEQVCDFPHLLRLLWHAPVLLLLGADGVAEDLRSGEICQFLAHVLPRELIQETAASIRDDGQALQRLKAIMAAHRRDMQPTAASLLHCAYVGWRPESLATSALRKLLPGKKHSLPLLRGAYLENADWPGIALSHVDISDADLSGANLSNATLDGGDAKRAKLRGARLTGASLVRFCADSALLSGADLSYVRAAKSSFDSADAQGTCFEGALLEHASFRDAKLGGANFARANLTGASLVGAEIEGANFSQAEFASARLTRLVLRLAEFRQCNFREAEMSACDLEGMVLPGTDFRKANLEEALFTGSVMPRADFRGATLVDAGLAEIDWEQADLRDADLRGASFHLGSSRSGLVDSPIASFGSRTGFYTDDYNDQDYKSPEEIRKANLRGADLRGASISGVDFYLVDLRDARYDASQEQHLRSCGAILESRVE